MRLGSIAAALKPGKGAAVVAAGSTALWFANRTPLPKEAPAGEGRRKTVFVTGGTKGLGLATVKHMAGRGDFVFTCGRDPARTAAVNELANVRAFVCDMASEASLRRLHSSVSSELQGKPLDVLVNNAGVRRDGEPILEERALAGLDESWATNVRAPVIMTQKFWPLLREADSPIILNVGSICSYKKFAFAFDLGYPLTKAALAAFSNTLRQEVTLVHPTARVVHFTTGAFQTDMVSDTPAQTAAVLRSYGSPYDRFSDKLQEQQEQAFAMLSPGRPEDFASAVAAVIHPADGEGSVLNEYVLNASLLELVVPWLPQSLLDRGAEELRPSKGRG